MQKITAQAPEATSPDFITENIEKLKALFPELLTEGEQGTSVNLDVLKQLVGDQTVTDTEEKYGLNWHGKHRPCRRSLSGLLATAAFDGIRTNGLSSARTVMSRPTTNRPFSPRSMSVIKWNGA